MYRIKYKKKNIIIFIIIEAEIMTMEKYMMIYEKFVIDNIISKYNRANRKILYSKLGIEIFV